MLDNVKAPALQFYPKDALDVKVIRMSDAAQGVYWRLLWNIWAHTSSQFSIKIDEKMVSKVLGIGIRKYRKYMTEIQQKDDPILIEEDGMYISKRLRQEKLKQVEWRRKSSIGGKHSAEKRARVVKAPLQPKGQPKGNTSFASSSNITTTKKLTPLQEVVEHFIKKQNITLETKEAISEYFKRHGRSASALLKLSGGVSKALSEIDRVSSELESKGLSWTLDTVCKHFGKGNNKKIDYTDKEIYG